MSRLTHVDEQGRARMVDVGEKPVTLRRAAASARLSTTEEVIKLISSGGLPKGDALAAARLAGIMAAKRTSELIPLCHPLNLDTVSVDFTLEPSAVLIRSEVRCHAKTGAEMEALVAASIAALTIYDMVKSADRYMTVEKVRLEEKEGGKSGHFVHDKARGNKP